MPDAHHDLHGAAPDRSTMALLVIDMISEFAFEGGDELLRSAGAVAPRILALKRRAAAAGVPTIYVNDNGGRWRSDFGGLLRRCARRGKPGAAIARLLRPSPEDYRVLKPKHSGFFATALDTLLQYLGARTLVLTGATSHQCVLFTANDAYVRDLRLVIPRDCLAARRPADTALALRYFRAVLDADVGDSCRVQFTPGSRGPRRPA
ncbi:MAG: cysteine hydrolase [Steroidobacteraceae bacterium]|jgi:nicotinamidase-related amidase|nr:cysteine hydrolase [Steroidobacteraceae bacterium]